MPIVSLTHWTQQFSTPGEQAFLGITMLLVGVLLVISILIILSLIVSLMSRLISGSGKKSAEPVAEVTKSVETEKVTQTTAAATKEDNGAIIAAITAAIQMMLAKESGEGASAGFRIKKIRRV